MRVGTVKASILGTVTALTLLRGAAVGSEFSTTGDGCKGSCEAIPDDGKVLHALGAYSEDELPEEPLRILVWNLYKGRKENFENLFAKLTNGAHLVLLSEVTLDQRVQPSLLALAGYGWEMATSFTLKGGVDTGVALGSRVEARNIRFTRTTDLEPVIHTPKAILLGEYTLPGTAQTLLALSIHGINWAGDGAFRRQLEGVVEQLRRHQGPVVFAGDFNIKNEERLLIAREVLATAGLKRVRWENAEKPFQLDDAYVRGVDVRRARLRFDVVGEGSDHPAIELVVVPHKTH
ncbi:MAG: endonuclease/exonuclease/phosphatase family protein [Oligoflexia bacterium]|nr:endonuclease/exonuclease/phosphatase family protein [Oligoflexia bacterium]